VAAAGGRGEGASLGPIDAVYMGPIDVGPSRGIEIKSGSGWEKLFCRNDGFF